MLSFKKGLFGLVMMLALVVGVSVDAGLTKTIVGNTQYQNNGVVQYQVSYTNTGTVPVTVRLSDTLPDSLMLLVPLSSATCNGVSSAGSTFTVAYNLPLFDTDFCTLQPGSSATMNYSTMIISQVFANVVNTAQASLYSGTTFLVTETASSTFSSYPVLSVVKNFTGINPQRLDDFVTFTIRVINSGAAVANNIVVSDTLPNRFKYHSSTLPGTASTNDITNTTSWTIPSIAANSSVEYTVVARLNTSIPGGGYNIGSTATNTVTIATGSTTTPLYVTFGSGGATSSAVFTIAGIPSVTLTKVLTSPTNRILSFSGATASYTITVTNTGTETAIGSVTDILPNELTNFSSSIAPSVINGNTWTWTGITLAPGASTTITLSGILSANYQSDRIFTNTATFAYAPNTSTGGLVNNGTATGLIQGLPNLVLQKNLIKSAPAGQSGDVVVYALTVTNSSATAYTGSRCLVDTFPSQVTLTSSSIAQSNCGTPNAGQITFSGTTLPTTIVLTGMLNTTVSSGTVITNSGTVTLQTGLELLLTDNTSSASFTIGGSDLVLAKTVGATTYTGTPGTPVTYTLQYANNGSIAVSGVVLTDILPSNLIYSGSSVVGASLSGSTVTRNLGTLASGQSGSVVLTALISGYVQGGIITNTATLSGAYQEANLQNNTASASFTVTSALADLSIVKSIISGGTYLSGSQYTFRLDVANIGGTTASGVVIRDVLPSIFQYVGSVTNLISVGGLSLSFTDTNNTITSDALTLSPGQSGYVLLTVRLKNNLFTTTTYTNTGTIFGDGFTKLIESSLVNNTSTVNGTITAPVISCSGLNFTITANSPLSNPVGLNTLSGVAVSYTYTLTNNLALPIQSLSVGTTWPSQVSTPSGLTAGIVGTANNIPTGSGVSYTLAGVTTADGISTITTPATFTVNVASGQSFTCTAISTLSVSQSCGNNVINTNLGEQCENYNGTVLVAPGVTFNPATQACDASCKIKTTKITNCVDMTVGGVVKNACVDSVAQPENPLLTIKKYINNQDAQDNSTAVSSSQGSTVSYKVVVTNTSSFAAYNVRFADTLPSGVTYVSNTISPTTITYDAATKTLTGNLGTLSAGASLTITFNATIDTTTNNSITNIAKVNYTDVLGVTKPELSDPAVIVLGTSPGMTCNNGIKEGSEACDLGNLPRTIGNYLDNSTNFLSSSNAGSTCTISCQIIKPVTSICGDGKLNSAIEQCDYQLALGSDPVVISQYLDKVGQNVLAGVYGAGNNKCTDKCTITGSTTPKIPACWYTDSVISVMSGELLPLSLQLELGDGLVSNESSCTNTTNASKIIESSVTCTFKLYGPGDEQNRTARIIKIYGQGCKDSFTTSNTETSRHDNKNLLFKEFSGPDADPLFVKDPRLTDYIKLDSSILGTSKPFGEYKLSLESVDYDYCGANGSVVKGNPYARVCQVDIAVTKPYLMQKGSVSTKTNANLSDFYMIDGIQNIYNLTDLDKVDKISSLNYANLSSSMKILTNNLIAKYEKIAVSAILGETTLKKVPGKSIYIMESGKTFKGANLTTPTTIIAKGNIIIEGDVSKNTLIIAQNGTVQFTMPAASTILGSYWANGCKSQVVNAIIIAQNGFIASPSAGYINNQTGQPRCRKGNLQVYGVLIGDNLDAVVNSRRSHLEHWFTATTNQYSHTDANIKAQRRDEIYKGASVYIEQNPSLWRDMPPAADEFLKTLNVSRS